MTKLVLFIMFKLFILLRWKSQFSWVYYCAMMTISSHLVSSHFNQFHPTGQIGSFCWSALVCIHGTVPLYLFSMKIIYFSVCNSLIMEVFLKPQSKVKGYRIKTDFFFFFRKNNFFRKSIINWIETQCFHPVSLIQHPGFYWWSKCCRYHIWWP